MHVAETGVPKSISNLKFTKRHGPNDFCWYNPHLVRMTGPTRPPKSDPRAHCQQIQLCDQLQTFEHVSGPHSPRTRAVHAATCRSNRMQKSVKTKITRKINI